MTRRDFFSTVIYLVLIASAFGLGKTVGRREERRELRADIRRQEYQRAYDKEALRRVEECIKEHAKHVQPNPNGRWQAKNIPIACQDIYSGRCASPPCK